MRTLSAFGWKKPTAVTKSSLQGRLKTDHGKTFLQQPEIAWVDTYYLLAAPTTYSTRPESGGTSTDRTDRRPAPLAPSAKELLEPLRFSHLGAKELLKRATRLHRVRSSCSNEQLVYTGCGAVAQTSNSFTPGAEQLLKRATSKHPDLERLFKRVKGPHLGALGGEPEDSSMKRTGKARAVGRPPGGR